MFPHLSIAMGAGEDGRGEMYWNLRIVKRETAMGDSYGIYEVFYESGKPEMRTENPVDVGGDSLEDLIEYQGMLCEAWDAPILTDDDFPDNT